MSKVAPELFQQMREDLQDFEEMESLRGWRKLSHHLERLEAEMFERVLNSKDSSLLLRDTGALAQVRAIRQFPALQIAELKKQIERMSKSL